ncbi:MAG: hypothetical protein ACE5EX_04920 [Phycisphaerae bacterium]
MSLRNLSIFLFAWGVWALPVARGQPSFVNWENAHVHPVDITPDSTTLLAVNTPDNRLELFDIRSGVPLHFASIPVGLDPVSVRARNNTQAWVVNHISDSISIVNLNTLNVVATVATDDEPADVVFSGTPRRAFVSCSQANTVLVIDPANPHAAVVDLADLPQDTLPAPDQLAVTVRIAIRGEDPRAMAVSADGGEVYIALFESGNRTTILAGGEQGNGGLFGPNVVNDPLSPYFDPAQPFLLGVNPPNPPPNSGTAFNPPIDPTLPPPPRVGLIVRNRGGQWMDDNNHDWTDVVSGPNADHSRRPVGWTLLDHDVAILSTQTFGVRYAGDLMHICMALAVNPASGRVTVVGTDATNEIRFEPVLNGRFLRVNLGSFDPAGPTGPAAPTVTDLNPHLTYTTDIPFVPIPQVERDRSIGDPRAIVWDTGGARAYVTGMGSNNVIVIGADGLRATARPIPVGEGPTGAVLDEPRNRLYVLNKFAATVSTIDTISNMEVLPRVALFDPSPAAIKIGRKHLYDTHRNSGLGHIACASCHVDSRMDRLAWDLGNPQGAMKAFNQNCNGNPNAVCDDWHPMKGPMTTQTLQDIIGKEPHHWRGDRNGLEEFAGAFNGLMGDDQPLPPGDMQEFENFLAMIHFPPDPFRNLDNTLPTALPLPGHFSDGRFAASGGLAAGDPLPVGNSVAGLALYRRPFMDGGLACVSCHTLPTGMGMDGVFVGGVFQPLPPGPMGEHHIAVVSSDGSTNRTMKIPHLRNQYEKTGFDTTQLTNTGGFGFVHDGSIDSIARFVSLPAFNIGSDQDVADLVAFMLALSGSDLPQGSPTNPLELPGPPSKDTHAAVGRQTTLDGTATTNGPIAPLLVDQLIFLADTGAVGLVTKGRQNGLQRGYTYIGGGMFQSDRAAEIVDAVSLRAAAAPGSELTFTAVPFGTQRRIGIDRDEDGHLDRDELDGCSDPADPTSVPPQCGAPCGGIAGIPCGAGEFCKFPPGTCDIIDNQGVCVAIPATCPEIFDPVCGCDGVTYDNACFADAAGVSIDHAGECVPPCGPPDALGPDPTGIAKNRFLSFIGTNAGAQTAVRVTFTALPFPFDILNGRALWVGPPQRVTETPGEVAPFVGDASPTFLAATLQCDPFFADWSQFGLVHVFHEAVVPDGLYAVQAVLAGCVNITPDRFSPPLMVGNSGHGDVVGPFDQATQMWTGPDGSVDIVTDAIAVLDKFAGRPGAPIKARADLEPSTPDRIINISDVVIVVQAFGGDGYPFTPDLPPCGP